MSVRLYHYAMVSEVCSTQQIYRFKARYYYPNKKLHQRDEKHQINQFLADCCAAAWRRVRSQCRSADRTDNALFGVEMKETLWIAC